MSVFANTRFYLHLIVLVGFLSLLILALVKPSLIPTHASLYVGLAFATLLIAIFFVALAYLLPKDSDMANDELSQYSTRQSFMFGYWATLASFLIMLGLISTENMSASVAFHFLGIPLGIIPSIYMIIAFLRGRAG